MTKRNKNRNNTDTKQPTTSPNDRNKKKQKDETKDKKNEPNTYENEPQSPRDLFGATSSGNPDETTDKTPPQDPTQTTTTDDHIPDEGTMDVDDEEVEDEDVEWNYDEQQEEHPATKGPLLREKLDLADDPIWTAPIRDATELWLLDEEWAGKLPYSSDEVEGTGLYTPEECLTTDAALGREFIARPDLKDGEPATIRDWIEVYAYAFDAEFQDDMTDCRKLRRMATRLALSDPVEIFQSKHWSKGSLLMDSDSHVAWAASYQIFGAPWKNRPEWLSSPATKRSTQQKISDALSRPKSVAFQTAPPVEKDLNKTSKAAVSPSPTKHQPKPKPKPKKMYLNRDLNSNAAQTAKIRNMKDYGRQNKTYVKIKLAQLTTDSFSEQEAEISTSWQQIMEKIWLIDSSLLILAWKDGSGDKPLRSRSEFPKTKVNLEKFTERLWFQKGKSPFCRILLSHDKDSEFIFNDSSLQSWLYENNLMVTIERIQARRIAKAGHLLGYHATACNTNNLAEAIEMQAVMQGIAVEIRPEFVNFDPRNRPGNQRTNVKILQVYVAWDKSAKARRALIEIYSSHANGLFPLGVQARFIPDVTDTRFIRTGDSVLAYTNSLKKHVKFMKGTKTHQSYNIIELDHVIDNVGMTLREATMHIFSASHPNWNLFVAVDTSFFGDCVNFAFREELEEEAMNMISALPLFLEASLGHQSVWNWFTRDARDEAAFYTWDMDLGIVPNEELDATNTRLFNWEQLDDIDDDDTHSQGVVLQPFRLVMDRVGDNAYNDGGTLVTNRYADRRARAQEDSDSEMDTDGDDDASSGAEPSGVVDLTGSEGTEGNASDTAASTETSTNQTTSTLTQTPDRMDLLRQWAEDPTMLEVMRQMVLQEASTVTPTNSGTSEAQPTRGAGDHES